MRVCVSVAPVRARTPRTLPPQQHAGSGRSKGKGEAAAAAERERAAGRGSSERQGQSPDSAISAPIRRCSALDSAAFRRMHFALRSAHLATVQRRSAPDMCGGRQPRRSAAVGARSAAVGARSAAAAVDGRRARCRAAAGDCFLVRYRGTLSVWEEVPTERVALCNVRMKTFQYDKL
jgi:hypothetical protein